MRKGDFLQGIIEIGDIHASRLEKAIQHLQHLRPFMPDKLHNFTDEELGYLELFTNRFAKLQDQIGSRLFPYILHRLYEDTEIMSFIDIVNKMEKSGVITSAREWFLMRELRNHITREYPDNTALMASNLNLAMDYALKLVEHWKTIKGKILNLEKELKALQEGSQ